MKNRKFGLGIINNFVTQIPLAGFLFIIPVFLQQVTKANAFTTGLTLLPASITILVFSLAGAKLSSIIDSKYVLMIGFIVSALGTYILGGVFNVNIHPSDIIPATIIFGVGIGLLLSQLTNLTMSAVNPDHETDASGLLNAFKNLGYSVGTALIGVLLLLGIFFSISAGVVATGQTGNMTKEQLNSGVFNYVEKMQTGTPPIPPELVPYSTQIINTSISTAMKQAFNVLAIILMIGFVTCIFIPRRKTS